MSSLQRGISRERPIRVRESSPSWVQVKAAGGVRTFEKLMEVRAIGVTRVGATATKGILDDANAKLGG